MWNPPGKVALATKRYSSDTEFRLACYLAVVPHRTGRNDVIPDPNSPSNGPKVHLPVTTLLRTNKDSSFPPTGEMIVKRNPIDTRNI
jgi:hypothetical protein